MSFLPRVPIAVTTLISLMVVCVVLSCTSDGDGDGVVDSRDKCPDVHGIKPDGCPVVDKINNIRVFMDRSESMAGYYKGNTEFEKNIVQLLAQIESIHPIKEVWLMGGSTEKYPGSATEFRQSIPQTPPKGGKSSQMDKIFKTIGNKTDTDDVSIFITDGILSFPASEIGEKGKRDINKDKASVLGTEIFATLDSLAKTKGFGVSIYAFWSAFNGIYYNYRNQTAAVPASCNRPYYIWVIGGKKSLLKFNASLSSISTFKPLEQMHFGLQEGPITSGTFLPSIEKRGEWELNHDGNGIENMGNTSSRICIAVNLSGLPPYAKRQAYLDSNINVVGCKSWKIIEKGKFDLGKIKSNPQIRSIKASTHLLIIDIEQMYASTGCLHITMPILADTWYQEWSCDSDLELETECCGKTFAFKHLIEGAQLAYKRYDKNFIDISYSLSR